MFLKIDYTPNKKIIGLIMSALYIIVYTYKTQAFKPILFKAKINYF